MCKFAFQIRNHTGMARIVVKLVTDEIAPKPHAHELIGKDCKDGVCTTIVKCDKSESEIM